MGEGEAAWQAFRRPLPLINETRSDEREDGRWDETRASEGKDAFACTLEFKTRRNLSPCHPDTHLPCGFCREEFHTEGALFQKVQHTFTFSSHSY